MQKFEVEVDLGLIVVNTQLLSRYFGKTASTISGWKKVKGMPVHEESDRNIKYELFTVKEWKTHNIKDKYTPKGKINGKEVSSDDEDFKIDLPFGMEIGNIDLNNSQHLGVLALHPFGETIRDTLKAREDIKQKRIKTAEIMKELISVKEAFRTVTEVVFGLRSSMQNMLRLLPKELENKKASAIKPLLQSAFKTSIESIRDIDNCKTVEDERIFDVIEVMSEELKKGVPPAELINRIKGD